jgi:SSS family solute:Na+ symporter
MAVLFPIELIIMYVLNKMGKGSEYEVKDVGAVDLTPWKYRHIVSIIGIIIAVIIYLVFSPLGIAK